MTQEKFALYGFELKNPDDWRVEFNPKGTRIRGDVVFHTPKRNKFYVSWGNLDDAKKQFETLEAHRDTNVKRIKKGSGVRDANMQDSREETLNGHRALVSHLVAKVSSGFMGRQLTEQEVWSMHLYCPESSRYYIVFSLLSYSAEFDNSEATFKGFAKSLVCHGSNS